MVNNVDNSKEEIHKKELEKAAERETPPKDIEQKPSSFHFDDIFETVEKMKPADMKKPDAILKVLSALIREKGSENRELNNKIEVLSRENRELSDWLATAKERLKQVGGIGTLISFFSLLAGIIIILATQISIKYITISLNIIAVVIYICCAGYYLWKGNLDKDVGPPKDKK